MESTLAVFETGEKPTEYSNFETATERLCTLLAKKDFCFVPAARTQSLLAGLTNHGLTDQVQFCQSWADLATDEYMADGGRYRKRRHATLSALPSSKCFQVQSHQPHFQSLTYNDLNGGIARHYEPIKPEILAGATMRAFLTLGCEIFGRLSPYSPWHIEAHQFRIESNGSELGLPTPEGVHRDGVSFVMMIMIQRKNLVNGGTKIFNTEKIRLDEFTLQHPFDMAIVNDERIFHAVTPIVQLDVSTPAIRDVLVLTFKRKVN